MKRLSFVQPAALVGHGSTTAVQVHRRYAAAVVDGDGRLNAETTQGEKHEADQQQRRDFRGNALGAAAEEEAPRRRNIIVLSNTTKAVYVHPTNHIASWYWFITDFHKWFIGIVFLFVGTQVIARYRVSKLQTATQAQIGENLLDQRTRDLLGDIEVLRKKDPIRLEHEANVYHEQFWKRRAMAVAQSRSEVRSLEIQRGKLQGEARGTDMTEWLGAKAKDDEEREVARRTQDYIQGFHQHLKSKRLI
ncbi:hypothetical protein LSCM1_01195 [Leishmania martiniquensis]|uniref:Uncharacterized protein n=1 Tax=Leishmania martiniquensis TaxID=1580590 RepID=A0A836KB18_9TRYP|nr:hypothetical protein LSCM1_01195 [Leishmania martiniquensis]